MADGGAEGLKAALEPPLASGVARLSQLRASLLCNPSMIASVSVWVWAAAAAAGARGVRAALEPPLVQSMARLLQVRASLLCDQ